MILTRCFSSASVALVQLLTLERCLEVELLASRVLKVAYHRDLYLIADTVSIQEVVEVFGVVDGSIVNGHDYVSKVRNCAV